MVKMAPFGRLSDENYELHDLAWKTDHEAAPTTEDEPSPEKR